MIDLWAVLLVFIGSLIGSVGTVLMKNVSGGAILQLWRKPRLWLGLFCYGSSVIFYLLALPREDLSVLYPLVSMNYIWTTAFSVRYLGEKMNKWKWIGLIGIVIGVIFIGLGS